MAEALKELPQANHPDLLVGFNTADDAGVFRLDSERALVQTVDFFPPIVDDPYWFGQIAAANALSDVYAMGGTPLTALNIVGFPAGMPAHIFTDIIRGGADKVTEAGAVVVGGHSIKDKELKYGLAVTGIVHPDRVTTNSRARVGDWLFLTKPLGTGIITTGIKRGQISPELTQQVIEQMAALNKSAAEAMLAHEAHAATDVTGFGLLGHAYEMASASGVTIRLFANVLPVLPDAVKLGAEGVNPGGANDNREHLKDKVRLADSLDRGLEQVLFDPQTSGGLLIAVAPQAADEFQADLRRRGLPDQVVGQVTSRQDCDVVVHGSHADFKKEST